MKQTLNDIQRQLLIKNFIYSDKSLQFKGVNQIKNIYFDALKSYLICKYR